MTIMVAKLTDEEPPPLVPPSTGLESWLVPKDDDGSPLAALLRFTVAEEGRLSSGFTEWVNAASDTEIDEIADRSCAALQEYEPEDDLTLTVRGLYDELPADDRETLDVETYAQLFGILSLLTCSEQAQAVLLP